MSVAVTQVRVGRKNWHKHPVRKWCHLYSDVETGELIKVKGATEYHGDMRNFALFGNRNHPDLRNRKLCYLGIGYVNVTGHEVAETVPRGQPSRGFRLPPDETRLTS